MGVRFVIGRAGTGKTRHCVEAMARQLLEEPLGPPLIYLVPEQATFTAERAIVTHPLVKGSFRTSVMGFRRLAKLIGRELGLAQGEEIDDLSRLILLEELVLKQREALRVFRSVADRPGFVGQLDATLRELIQYGHTGGSLRELAEALGGDAGAKGAFVQKLHDLALLLDAWNSELYERHWDPEKLADLAAKHAGRSKLVHDARVWVDGFSSLNVLEVRLLVALAEHARQVEITLLADPDLPGIADEEAAPDRLGVFARSERLYRLLGREFKRVGVRIEEPLAFRDVRRFNGTGELKAIEAELFDGHTRSGPAEIHRFAPAHQDPLRAPVELWECGDPETEVVIAAQRIRDMAARDGKPGCRYRDIGVVIPDLERYADAVRRVFSAHGIPHFIDQRRTIAHHPLVEFLRSAVGIVLNGWARDDVMLLLKTGLCPVADADIHLVENYLLAHGIDHVPWDREWRFIRPNVEIGEEEAWESAAREVEELRRVNQVRAEVARMLRGWVKLAGGAWGPAVGVSAAPADGPPTPETKPTGPGGGALARGLYELMERVGVGNKIAAMMGAAGAAGDAEMRMVHHEAWKNVVALLEDLERVLRGRQVSLETFARLMATAMENMTLGLIPPTVDQVLVSNVTRSKHPELQVVMILGASEGQLPKVTQEDPLLSDAQRDTFEQRGAGIGAGSNRRLLEMPFFDYVAFTRASRKLVVSYPLASEAGRAVGRSRYVDRLVALFPDLVLQRFDATARGAIERVATPEDAVAAVVRWVRERTEEALETRRHQGPEGQEKATGQEVSTADAADPARAARCRDTADTASPRPVAPDSTPLVATYNWLVSQRGNRIAEIVSGVWRSIEGVPEPRLEPGLAGAFYGRKVRMSVSQLEKFGACPLEYFMYYTLGLRRRAMLAMDVLNLGTLYHRILERLYDRIIAGHLKGWPSCGREPLQKMLDEVVDKACAEVHAELQEVTPAYAKMQRRAKRVLGYVVEAHRRAAEHSVMRPEGTEVRFGSTAGASGGKPEGAIKVSLPVLEIDTPGGRVVEINGKVDRVDKATGGPELAVVDYKSTTQRKMDLYLLYYGLELQLPIYLLVVQGGWPGLKEVRPVASFYVPLHQGRKRVQRPEEADNPDDDVFFDKAMPRGIMDASAMRLLDDVVTGENKQKSSWFQYSRTADGKLGGDALEPGDFDLVLAFARRKVAGMVDALATGRIAPRPYRDKTRTPCDQCDFVSFCPFDPLEGEYRHVPSMKRELALARMAESLARPAGAAASDTPAA